MKIVFAAFALLLLLVLAIIGIQNPTLITIHFLGWQTGVLPLWVIMVASLISGMVLGGIIAAPGRVGRYQTTRRLRRELTAAEDIVHSQATAPVEQRPTTDNPGRMKPMP